MDEKEFTDITASCRAKKRFAGEDIVITDPMYICKDGDWEGIGKDGQNMSLLGFKNFLSRPTAYHSGWICGVRATSESGQRFIRHFCGDSGQVGVFALNEILRYRPDFRATIDGNPQAFALIRSFDGEAVIDCGYNSTRVTGAGNISFRSWKIS